MFLWDSSPLGRHLSPLPVFLCCFFPPSPPPTSPPPAAALISFARSRPALAGPPGTIMTWMLLNSDLPSYPPNATTAPYLLQGTRERPCWHRNGDLRGPHPAEATK